MSTENSDLNSVKTLSQLWVATAHLPLSCWSWFQSSIMLKWANKNKGKYNNHGLGSTSFSVGQNLTVEIWVWEKVSGGASNRVCAWMWVAWVQNPSLPFSLKGKSLSHDSAAAASERSREMKAPDPGPQRGATEKVGGNRGLQRSEEIREEGYSEDHALPWAEHTHAHKHTCRIHTPYKGLRVDANNNAATIQSLGQTKFILETSLCRPHMLIANVLTFKGL